jgi:hypothetical protein
VTPVELTDGRGGRGWGRSQTIRKRERLVFYNLPILSDYRYLHMEKKEEGGHFWFLLLKKRLIGDKKSICVMAV